jgi:CubicO group peptidase (beta-lactamase class C family)
MQLERGVQFEEIAMTWRTSTDCFCASMRRLFWLALSVTPWLCAIPPAQAADTVQALVDAYAGRAVARGEAVGMAVAIVHRNRPARFFTYGSATLTPSGEPGEPVTLDSLFEIASLTKVFTTNLLGQSVAKGEVRLVRTLGQYRGMLGPLPPLKQQITLGELAAFTSGLKDGPPFCTGNATPATTGCLPYHWPPPDEYTAADFMTFIRQTHLRNWQTKPPQQLTSLPAPYHYSNAGIGLLGLILGTPRGQRISNASLSGWTDQLNEKLLQPLGMTETFLDIPSAQQEKIALGYDPATAVPILHGDTIARIKVTQFGSGYDPANPPQVQILGGGGSGRLRSRPSVSTAGSPASA